MSQKDRLEMLAEKYHLRLRKSKSFTLKLGAVCCDCGAGTESKAFCQRLVGPSNGGFKLPTMLWSFRGQLQVSSRSPRNAADVVHVALAHLGLSEGSQGREDL
eukprot:symbB.v1.2.037931.t1/scaffold5743.1/size24046/2